MFKQAMMAAAAATGISAASGASAATFYDFRSPGASGTAESLDFGLFDVTSNATVLGFNRPSRVSYGAFGLGVASLLDTQPGQIDGFPDVFPAASAEWLTVTFDNAVRLNSFTLGRLEFGDEYAYSINGGALTDSTLAFNEVAANNVTSLSIFAQGTLSDAIDDFTLKGIEVAAVPLPAAGLLLAGGLGLLGAARRSRRTA